MLTHQFTRGGLALGKAVEELYSEGQTDYSLEPMVLTDMARHPLGRIREGDSVIFCCRRGEREIQLTEAFTDPGFSHFPRPALKNLQFVILTLYHEKFKNLPVAFMPVKITGTLGEAISQAGLQQLHIAESEKFAHVTFFFNGGNNKPFTGEQDRQVPSLQGIPFDQVPELSLPAVAEQVLQGMGHNVNFIVANFANGDVIGHTSNNAAKIRCAAVVDAQLGRVLQAAADADYVTLVTADHGNLELMVQPDGTPHVAHTANPVKLVLIDPRPTQSIPHLQDGKLADVAPIVLSALGLAQPASMAGRSLVGDHDWKGRRRMLLVILDGWGIGQQNDTNPIFLAATPTWDHLISHYPCCELQAAGEAVGLQAGKAGNSEAGHMNLGAGRVILQDDIRLDQAMKDGSFYHNEIFCRVMQQVKNDGANLHLIGLLTERSSHGSIEYPLALLHMAKEHGLEQIYLHLIFDGRSTAPGSAPALLEKLEHSMEEIGAGLIVSGVGRALALDRDGNYEKTRRAYEALVSGQGRHFKLD